MKWGGRALDVHRLSLAWSLGRPVTKGMDACHRCDVRACVRPDHLYEGTRRQNVADSIQRRRHAHGETNGNAKLTEAAVIQVGASDKPDAELADTFGVSPETIRTVRRQLTWRHVRAAS